MSFKEKKMLECIKFGEQKIRTIQVGDDCFVSIKKIGEALDMTHTNFKALVQNHLPEHLRMSRSYIGLDISYERSKIFTTIAGACRLILASKHPDRFEVLDFLLDRHDQLQDELWKVTKVEPPTLDDSVPEGEKRDFLYFIYELGEPFTHKNVEYNYMCVCRRRRDMKRHVKTLKKTHPNSRLILKLVNDPIRLWEQMRSIQCHRNYFRINRGHHHIFTTSKD